jgi:hypothetical protein
MAHTTSAYGIFCKTIVGIIRLKGTSQPTIIFIDVLKIATVRVMGNIAINPPKKILHNKELS